MQENTINFFFATMLKNMLKNVIYISFQKPLDTNSIMILNFYQFQFIAKKTYL